ncbi:hypothetical protein F5887DRAFT_609819 [Amanita rubescens]|nr:hypothetical protein F5887DRAFT_609819 [Amanita rubescens]
MPVTSPVSSRAKKVPLVGRSTFAYRSILNITTKYPRAGKHNNKVEDFVNLCTAIWESVAAIGEHANWFIDTMWWATRLTFNSPRVLRHMTRLLFLSGDTSLGKRTLKVHARAVGKAWPTQGAQMCEETDTNENWVELLVFGVRMLCKAAVSAPGARTRETQGDWIQVKRNTTIQGLQPYIRLQYQQRCESGATR